MTDLESEIYTQYQNFLQVFFKQLLGGFGQKKQTSNGDKSVVV